MNLTQSWMVNESFRQLPEYKTFSLSIRDDEANDKIQLMILSSNHAGHLSSNKLIKTVYATDTEVRLFKHYLKGAEFVQFYSPKTELEKAYLCTRFDYENDVSLEIVAVDNSGATSGDNNSGGTKAEISGTVTIEGTNATRQIIVIADDKTDGRRVVAEVESDSDGTFKATYNDWAGAVIALALDNYGDAWNASTAINTGTIVHPSTATGYVFKCTVAGTSGEEEPAWSTNGTTSVTDGSVIWSPQPYYRPVASGPIEANVTQVEENPTPNFQFVRVLVTENNGADYLSILEIEIASIVAGADITTSEMTVTNSSSYSGGDASNAFDNTLSGSSSSWTTSGWTPPEWVIIDLGAAQDLVEIRIMPDTGFTDRAPKAFEIQGSNDGETFETIKVFNDATDWVDETFKIFSLVD